MYSAIYNPMRRWLNQDTARRLDELLMARGFSIDQLMELAGLAVAQSVQREFPPSKVLIVCGPGNNGGDGLVAARHLQLFGYQPEVYYPKRTESELYRRLVNLLDVFQIPVRENVSDYTEFPVIIDAIFGFSFRGEIREPFRSIITAINAAGRPIVSVDIPSGWDVEQGNTSGQGILPTMLISLSAPKLCATHFQGVHYIGGRFIPGNVAEELGFDLPTYPAGDQIVRLGTNY